MLDDRFSAVLVFKKELYQKQNSDKLFYALLNSLNFEKKTVNTSFHHIALFSTTSRPEYITFSTNRYMLKIKNDLESSSQLSFNTCRVSLFRDNDDFLRWFSQNNSSGIITDPNVGFVSFGDSRRLELCRRGEKLKSAEYFCYLEQGSALVTRADVQRQWLYSVPRELHQKTPFLLLFFTNQNI